MKLVTRKVMGFQMEPVQILNQLEMIGSIKALNTNKLSHKQLAPKIQETDKKT